MLSSTLSMCISKGTHSSGKHFMAYKLKKVKNTEMEKQPVSDWWFVAASHAQQPGAVQHQEGRQGPAGCIYACFCLLRQQLRALPKELVCRQWGERCLLYSSDQRQVQTMEISKKGHRKQLHLKHPSPILKVPWLKPSHFPMPADRFLIASSPGWAARVALPVVLSAASDAGAFSIASHLCL